MIKNTNNVRKYSHHAVPCNKCHECRARRGAGWSFRLRQEEKKHATAFFVTYTYSDENLPRDDCGFPTLVKEDLQKYFKILRKRLVKSKVKYYACGEYGSITARPHYHAIIFGAPRDVLEASWKHGHCYVGEVSAASIAYVCGYVNKPRVIKHGDSRSPEFNLMSKGLGLGYVTDKMVKWHKDNMAAYCVLEGGVKTSLPRYYRDKIFDAQEKEQLAVLAEINHEIRQEELIQKKGYGVFVHEQHEAIVAAIRREDYKHKISRSKI